MSEEKQSGFMQKLDLWVEERFTHEESIVICDGLLFLYGLWRSF